MLLHLCMRTLLVANGRNNVLRGLHNLAKENYRKSISIEDYQTFNIPFLFLSNGDNFQFFTNLINSKLFSELVSSD